MKWYKILPGKEVQLVTVPGDYTVTAEVQRESYAITLVNSAESVVQSGWYNGSEQISEPIECKFADRILYDPATYTISIRDIDNSQIVGSAVFKYTDDPTINEKVWISDVPSTMPAMNLTITGMVVEAGATEYSLNIKLDDGISKV